MSSPSPSLIELANQIQQNASSLQTLLKENGYPQPTLSTDSIQTYPTPAENETIYRARLSLIEASRTMLDFALGPTDALKIMAGPENVHLAALRVILHFDIARIIPIGREMSFTSIAKAADVDSSVLERILRISFAFRLFRESKPGFVAHTALSAAIPPISAYLRLVLGKILARSLLTLPEALKVWSEPLKPGVRQKPLNIAYDTDQDFWEVTQAEPNGMEHFSDAMKSLAASPGHSLSHVVNGFDWEALGKGPVLDIGGGNGFVAMALAKAYPDLNVVIQDLPSNEEAAKDSIPQELEERVTFMPHDFFKAQPVIEAGAYFLRNILHDWQDEDCIRIIRYLLPGLERGMKLFTCDVVLPVGAWPLHLAKIARSIDLIMFGVLGAKERSLDQWKELCARVHPRLKVVACRQPLGSDLAMLEIGLEQGADKTLRMYSRL